jgi:hypothetical protein
VAAAEGSPHLQLLLRVCNRPEGGIGLCGPVRIGLQPRQLVQQLVQSIRIAATARAGQQGPKALQ